MNEFVAKKYITDYEQMGLGMFVHWGIYSQLGMSEWTLRIHNRKLEDYVKLTQTFTAEDFDAEELVLTAKNGGCKYIIFTTRHHDGFSLYDTCGLSDYDAPHSAAKRDLVREFVDACNKHGIVPFLYHTTLDWHHPDYTDNFDKYLEYLFKSVEILCTRYGKIGGFWFDGNWNKPDADWREDELYDMIRSYQPEAVLINNSGLALAGQLRHPKLDVATYEKYLPTAPLNRSKANKYIAGEMVETINDNWGFGKKDLEFKSPKELIEHICICRKFGVNYVLNIGPMGQGAIEPIQREILRVVGYWMELYGEAVYDGRPCEADGAGNNFVLRGNNCLYFFFYDLSRNGHENVTNNDGRYCGAYAFGNVTDEIESIEWMDTNEQLTFYHHDNMLLINATGYPYGMATCVRVAKAKIKPNL